MAQRVNRKKPTKVKKKHPLLSSPLITIVGLALIALLTKSLTNLYQTYQKALEIRDKELANIEELQQKELSLEASLEHIRSDEGLDMELRDRYRLIKEGEGLIVLLEENEEVETKEINPPEKKIPWWKRIFKKKSSKD